MIDYVFMRQHTLDRVLYQVGDEIQRTPRLGDWLIAQGVPLRRKEPGDVVRETIMPRVSLGVQRQFIAPRFKCCGWK